MQSIIIEDANWRDEFGKKLFDLQQSGQFCDVIIKTIEDARLLVHSCVLAASSPLLKGVIESALSDATLGTIMLSSDIDVNTWTHMLEFMYTGYATVPDTLVASLQSGATILKVDTLVNKCNEILPNLTKLEEGVEAVPVEAADLYSAIVQIKEDTEPVEEQSSMVTVSQDDMQVAGSIVTQHNLSEGTIVTQHDLPEGTIVTQHDLPEGTIVTQTDIDETEANFTEAQTNLGEGNVMTENVQEKVEDVQPDITEESGMEGQESMAGAQDEMDTQDYIDDVHDAPTIEASITIHESDMHENDCKSEEIYVHYEEPTKEVCRDINESDNFYATGKGKLNCEQCKIIVSDTNSPLHYKIANEDIKIKTPEENVYVVDNSEVYQIVTNTEECVTITTNSEDGVTTMQSITDTVPDNLPIEFEVLGFSEGGKKKYKCLACNKICMNPTDHRKVHSEARPFVCDYEGCGKSYKCKTNLNQHIEANHVSKSLHQCSKCGKGFKTKYLLLKHLTVTHSDSRPFSCQICGKRFKVLRTLKYHEGLHSEYKPIACDICGKGVASRDHLKVHMTACHDVGNVNCFCGKVFHTLKKYKDHYRLHHDPNNKNKCDVCNKNLISAAALAAHKVTHNKPFACRICRRGFSNELCCFMHEKKSHKNELKDQLEGENTNYTCLTCGKVCSSKSSYLKHKETHLDKAPGDFKCLHCEKTFSKQVHLKNHSRIHVEKPLLYCKKCGKKFKSEKLLTTHQTSCRVKSLTCEICDISFPKIDSLQKHMKCHNAETLLYHKCKICFKNFISQNKLKEHMHSEHGTTDLNIDQNYVYDCEICSAVFKSEGMLNKHEIELHSNHGDKYKCNECSVNFLSCRTLQKHQFVDHCKGTQLNCKECNREFYSHEFLCQHEQIHQGENVKSKKQKFHSLFLCLICLRYFNNRNSLKDHEQTHDSSDVFCKICNKLFSNITSLKLHAPNCSTTKCFYCCQEFEAPDELKTHIKFHLLGKIVYKCSVCSKEFNSLPDLQTHRNKHETVDSKSDMFKNILSGF